MGVYHGNDLRKPSGGIKGRHRKVKRKYELGRYPVETRLSHKEQRKIVRVRGGGYKIKVVKVSYANVNIPATGETQKVRILKVLKSPASQDYDRRGIITKGTLLQTEIGIVKVVSRPGQDGVINAILIEKR
ncbi:MAG: 30S ribosomal protein S8e [Thermoprotei archaeon]|nr:MAG: 30S ribosomal protein S8e [Thermoprotei archaeon]